jgi:hypothetical protein
MLEKPGDDGLREETPEESSIAQADVPSDHGGKIFTRARRCWRIEIIDLGSKLDLG